MSAKPNNWNVVISGAWNLAILTPDGVRKRLFKLAEGTPLQIEVAIDQPGQFRVVHDGVIVTPASRQLDVSVQTNNIGSLEKACRIAGTAIETLPETPIVAAGVNFRFTLDALPDALIDLLKSSVNDAYSDAGYSIIGSLTQRSLEIPPGVINVEVREDKDGAGTVLMNFHYASSTPAALREWLSRSAEFWDVTQKLLVAMNVTLE